MSPVTTLSITCGHCDLAVAGVVVAENNKTVFLTCPSCGYGSVFIQGGSVWPPGLAGDEIQHLPADVAGAWAEARRTHSVAAYTASEMMCRKILMHVAVDKAQAKPGAAFTTFLDALDSSGYIAPGLRAVMDQIRTRGNGATHELPASTAANSLETLGITGHLLKTVYELPQLLGP